MFCKICGAQIPDDAQFCPKCGGALGYDAPAPSSAAPASLQSKPTDKTALVLQYVFTALALLEALYSYFSNVYSSFLADDSDITAVVFGVCTFAFLFFGLFMFAPVFLQRKKWLAVLFYIFSICSAIFIGLFNVTYSDVFAISGFAAALFVILAAVCANFSGVEFGSREKLAFTIIYLLIFLVMLGILIYFTSPTYAINRGMDRLADSFGKWDKAVENGTNLLE